MGIVLFMCSEIENPNPSRTQMAPRRTSHARRRPGSLERTLEPSRVQNRPGSVCAAGIGHDYLVDGGSGSTRCGRRDSPPQERVWGAGGAKGIHRRDAPKHAQPIDDTRHCSGCVHAFWVGVREWTRFQSLPAQHDSSAALPAGRRRMRLENGRGRVAHGVLALEAWPAHVRRAVAARRRSTCVIAQGSD